MGNRSRHVRPTDGSGPASRAEAERIERARYRRDGERHSAADLIDARREAEGWRKRAVTAEADRDALKGRAANAEARAVKAEAERDEFKKEAKTDSLTGLGNRRALYEMLMREVSIFIGRDAGGKAYDGLGRRKGPAVIFIDVEGLGKTNNVLGDEAGDALIHNTAETINSLLRKHYDLQFRMDEYSNGTFRKGGDEFVVILHESTLEGVKLVEERLRNKCSSRGISIYIGGASVLDQGDQDLQGTLLDSLDNDAKEIAKAANRLGKALFDNDAKEIADALVHLADRRMLKEKNGRKKGELVPRE